MRSMTLPEPVSDSQLFIASSTATAAASLRKVRRTRAQDSTSRCRGINCRWRPGMSRNGTILLVEDNPDDIDLTLKAFENSKIVNRVTVVRDGEEALNYLISEDSPESHQMP